MRNTKMSRLLRSCIACLLAVCLVASAVPVFAADYDGDVLKYVSLGASNVNGYGMEGYRFADGKNVYGYKQIVEKAYPYLFSQALEEATGKTVELTQLAISSFRAEEVHVLLDDNYNGDGYTRWRFHHTGTEEAGDEWFDRAVYADGIYTENNGIPGDTTALNHLRDVYQTAVAEADVISLDIGMNNFGVYLTQRIFDYFQGIEPNFEADLSRFSAANYIAEMTNLSAQIRELIRQPAVMTAAEEEESESMIDFLLETILYAYLGLITDFDAILNHIYTLNPDAEVVVVGMYNTMEGVDLVYDGTEIPLGDVFGLVLDLANAHMEKLSVHALRYTYVDASGRHNFYEQLMLEGASYATMSPEGQKKMYEFAQESTGLEDPAAITFAADAFTKIFIKALNNPRMDMASLANMDTTALTEAVAGCVATALQTGVVDTSFLDEEPYATLGFFYCRFFFEDWFFIHPDEQGHSEAAEQIMDAYRAKYLNNPFSGLSGIFDKWMNLDKLWSFDFDLGGIDMGKQIPDLKEIFSGMDFSFEFPEITLPRFDFPKITIPDIQLPFGR